MIPSLIANNSCCPAQQESSNIRREDCVRTLCSCGQCSVFLDDATCDYIRATVENLSQRGHEVPWELQRCYDAIINNKREVCPEDLREFVAQLPQLLEVLTSKELRPTEEPVPVGSNQGTCCAGN